MTRNFDTLQVGKQYKTRDGEVVTIVKKDEKRSCPFVDSKDRSFTLAGFFYADHKISHLDLIEEIKEESVTKERALRYNSGKPPMHFIPLDMLQGLARVLEDGAVKYLPNNWRKGAPTSEQIDSLLRHLCKLQSGEMCDQESGLPHVDHMLFNVISLRLALELEGKIQKDPGQGNRVKEKLK